MRAELPDAIVINPISDLEAELLARVYWFILSWPECEPEKDNALASLTRTSAVMNGEISKLATKAEVERAKFSIPVKAGNDDSSDD